MLTLSIVLIKKNVLVEKVECRCCCKKKTSTIDHRSIVDVFLLQQHQYSRVVCLSCSYKQSETIFEELSTVWQSDSEVWITWFIFDVFFRYFPVDFINGISVFKFRTMSLQVLLEISAELRTELWYLMEKIESITSFKLWNQFLLQRWGMCCDNKFSMIPLTLQPKMWKQSFK